MKKLFIIGALVAAGMSLTGCDDFLNNNRYPESKLVDSPDFWNNPSNVQGQINSFYEDFLGYGNSSGAGEFYFSAVSDDQANIQGKNTLAEWKNTNVSSSAASWNSPYVEIRRSNLIIQGVEQSTLNDTQKGNFIGIARMMRAWHYYQLVRAYGDVPLVTRPLDPTDEAELFGPRTPRNTVMDFVLEDLDYAIGNISTQKSKTEISADLARAIKSEVCLFEGSFAKYHQNDNGRANKFFGEAAAAALPLLTAYPIGDNYQATYNSFSSAALANPELIFVKNYVVDELMHCTVDYTSSSTTVAGMTRDAFEAYLFIDGKPLALTSCDKTDAGVAEGDNACNIANLLAVRDGRLAQTTDEYIYYSGMEYQRANSMPMTSATGYGVSKFNNFGMPYGDATTIRNYTVAPLFWGAMVACNYMEAKAELGTLTDADLDLTLNKMFQRANLPVQTVAGLSAMNDPANNMGVSSLLWEIRRCRRCELIFDKGLRYWDLVRWHKLDLLDSAQHPNITMGANMLNAPVKTNGLGAGNNYVDAANGSVRVFNDRQYFYPIPSGQLELNPELTQNPGWGTK